MQSRFIFIKPVSLALALLLFWGAVFPDSLSAQTASAKLAAELVRPAVPAPVPSARIEWHPALSGASNGTVYLFQDAHSSLEAQKKIAESLKEISAGKNVDMLWVEGAAGRLTRERFNTRPSREMIEALERSAYLNGAAAFFLAQPKMQAQGLEDAGLYRRNFSAFRSVYENQKKIQRWLEAGRAVWRQAAQSHFPEKTAAYFLNTEEHHLRNPSLRYFYDLTGMAADELNMSWDTKAQIEWPELFRVQRLIELEKSTDLIKARRAFDLLRQLFSDGDWDFIALRLKANPEEVAWNEDSRRLRSFAAETMRAAVRRRLPLEKYRSFFDWLAFETLRSEIHPERLLDEAWKLEDKIAEKAAGKGAAYQWLQAGRWIQLLDKAGRLELTRREFALFRSMVSDPAFKKWSVSQNGLEDFLRSVQNFYETAEKRDRVFAEKIRASFDVLKAQKISQPRIAAVIGGYHKEGILDSFRNLNVDVAVVTPHMKKADTEVDYLDAMLGTGTEKSTLAFTPAAVLGRGTVVDLLGTEEAVRHESLLTEILTGRSEARHPVSSRRKFLAAGAALLSAPILAAGQDAIDSLLRDAGEAGAPAPKADLAEALFAVEPLKINSQSGMEGYLPGIMSRVENNLPGIQLKWSRVLAETQVMRANRISFMPSFSQSKGFQGGIQIAGMAGERLEISDGGLSFAMKTIGLLLDEILVNPVRNQADAAAIQSAEFSYQMKKTRLAGEVVRLLVLLKMSEAKMKVTDAYIAKLTGLNQQVEQLVQAKATGEEHLHAVTNYLNQAKDARGELEREIVQAREGMKIILGSDFNFDTAKVPVPSREWLRAGRNSAASLAAVAKVRAGRAFDVQAAEAQAQAYSSTAKAEKRRGFFSFFFRRGPAKPEKTMQNLNLKNPGLSSNPEAAQAQVHAEAVKIEREMLLKNLEMLVSVETTRFVTAREAHELWQKQVDEEQAKWRVDSSFVAAGYTLDMLARLKSFVHAQLRVMETRGEMSGSSAAMMAAGLDEMGANSANWAKPVLISDFFPENYKPVTFSSSPPRRSEIRSLLRSTILILVQAVVFLQMAFAQMPAAQGIPKAAADAVSFSKKWEGQGMSPVSADESTPMHLKLPETAVSDAQGKLRLNPEAEQRYENLRGEFETGLKSYLSLKKGGAKPAELLPAFKLLLAKGLELDRLERILKALETAKNSAFKVITRQTGTVGAGQSVLELISNRIAVVRAHIPLKELLGSQIQIEIAGQAGTLISRPKILETDLAGADGNVLVEIKAAVEKSLDLNSDQPFRIILKKAEDSVAQSEPAEILLLAASGAEIPAGVALLLREEIPLAMPEFGAPALQPGKGAGNIKGGSRIASIPFERQALMDFLLRESADLGASIGEALQILMSTSGFTDAQINVFRENSRIGEMTAKQIANARDLASPADGLLDLSPELASGLSLNAGQAAAWIRTSKIRAQTALSSSGSISAGDSTRARLPDGRVLTGKVISISSANQAQISGRREVTVEFDMPASTAELDWSSTAGKNGLSPSFLYALLAEAHQKPGQIQPLMTEGEFSGPAGAAAAAVQSALPSHPKTLAQLIAESADVPQALQDLKRNKSSFGDEDYQVLLRSSQLSLAFETARFMIRDRSEWAGLMRAFAAAQKSGDHARIRAIYDGMTSALTSGGPEIEAGLIRLGTILRGDRELNKTAESVFAALLAERGMNDRAVRRLLDSGLWTLPELNTFASGLNASSDSAVKKTAGGIFELIWRLSADYQISSIKNSAFWEKMVSGRDPEHALNWLSPEDYLKEFIYRESLAADRLLLRDGIVSTGGQQTPQISLLIDGKTAEKISVSPETVPAVTVMPGILGVRPVSLGEWDVMPVQDQEAAVRTAASRGDFELLTWILKSKASPHLKKAAAAALQANEQGMLFFAGWFAEEADPEQAAVLLRSYGIERFMADMTARVSALQKHEASDRSAAPERQILLRSLFKWYVWFKDSPQNIKTDPAVRLLMMLILDPADLGMLARGEAPVSPEALWIARLPASVYRPAALQELWRRSASAAAAQYPLYSRSQAIIGESRPGNTASESLTIASLLAPESFAANPAVRSGDVSAARGDLTSFFKAKLSDPQAAGDMIRLAQGHFDAGYSGKVTVPSASGHNAGLMWTLFRYALNFLGFISLGLLTWVFWRQTLVRYKKLRAMGRGEAVQFYDSVQAWKDDFRMEILNSGVVQETEGKRKVISMLDQWSDELAASRPDFSKIKGFAEEAFSWPNFSLRLENFKGFRNDDRQRDRILAYALNSLVFLTLKRVAETPGLSSDAYDLHEFLKGRSERLVIFSFILFQLKNLKENESYNAIEPNIANLAIQRERLKSYNFQRRVWKSVRSVYRLDKASVKIRRSIQDLVQGYAEVSQRLGIPVSQDNIDEMLRISRTQFMPREHWGKSPDNSTISGDRKLASRIFTFLAAIASLPSIWAQIQLIMTFHTIFSMGGWVAFGFLSFSLNAILLFSLFSYFSHLIANMSNLHDVQAEEYLNHLTAFDRIVQYRKSEITEAAPARLPLHAPQLPPPAFSPPAASLQQPAVSAQPVIKPFNWGTHLAGWSADKDIAALVVFVSAAQADHEEEKLGKIFSAADKKFSKALFVDGLDDLSEVDARIAVLPAELSGKVPAGKIVFVVYENSNYRLLPVTAQIPSAAAEKNKQPVSGREVRVEQMRNAKSLKDVLAVMEAELLSSDEPGFDGVVVSVNRHFADEARRSLPAYFKKRLGFDVPVQVIVPPDVEHGNGSPLLYYYSQLGRARQSMSAGNSVFAGKESQGLTPRILFIEATSKFDFWNSALGSVMFAPAGVQDKNQREIRTGDAAAAYASLAGYSAWTPADSVFLANGVPEADGSDMTLISAVMPAKDVAGRYGVVLPKNQEKANGRVLDLVEKPASVEDLNRVVGSRTKHEVEIQKDSRVQAFTGTVFFHFQDQDGETAAQREKDFQAIMAGLYDSWQQLSAAQTQDGFLDLDKVYDLLIPIIKINTIRGYDNAKSALINYASFRGRGKTDAARRTYEDFYLKMLEKFHAASLRLKINNFSAVESYFADVREIPQFQRHILQETAVLGQPRTAAAFPSSPFATKDSVLIGSNGDTPAAFQKLEYKELFSVAAMRDGRKVRLFGAKKSFTPEQRKNLGICVQCILGNDMQPLYPDAQDIRDIPLFSTYEGPLNSEQADSEAGIIQALLSGRRVMAGSREQWERNRISLTQFEAGANYDPFASRLDPKPAVRNELRALQSLAAGLRSGRIPASFFIFRGTLDSGTPAAVAMAAAAHEAEIMRWLYQALPAQISESSSLTLPGSIPVLNAQQTLFIDGRLFAGREAASWLESFSRAPFRVEVLYAQDQLETYDRAAAALKGKSRGSLYLRHGATLGEMIQSSVSRQVQLNADRKYDFAFAGRDAQTTRRMRQWIGNLVSVETDTVSPVLLLEALTSPAVFALAAPGRQNAVWTWEKAMPLLLAAARRFSAAA